MICFKDLSNASCPYINNIPGSWKPPDPTSQYRSLGLKNHEKSGNISPNNFTEGF